MRLHPASVHLVFKQNRTGHRPSNRFMDTAAVVTMHRQDAQRASASTEHDISTASLVERARSGDERAYEAVYRRYVGRVYALSLRMCGDAQTAEEITQEPVECRRTNGVAGDPVHAQPRAVRSRP